MTAPARRRRVLLGGVLALAVLAGGCTRGQDDELAPRPTRTVTVTPSPTVRPPDEVPVGRAAFGGRAVWAQGSDLHVGARTIDLAPVRVDRLVATPGGVYAVLATAISAGGDVTFVVATQVLRVIVMLLVAPVLARFAR